MKKSYKNYLCIIEYCTHAKKCANIEVSLTSQKSKYPDFKLNAEALLRLQVGQSIDCGEGKRMEVIHLDKVKVWDGDTELPILEGFHTIREDVRNCLNKNKLLNEEIKTINKELAMKEVVNYISGYDDVFEACKRYFFERFPQETKEAYYNSVEYMFRKYDDFFSLPAIRKEIYSADKKIVDRQKTETIFRTKRDQFGENYTYAFKVPKDLTEFINKFFICVCKEMNAIQRIA